MALTIYNTLTRKTEEFVPLEAGKAGLYTCGPTVYNFAHIGNLRAYVFQDLFKRYLRYKGFKVMHVMNLTDVDDKTIRNSREQNLGLAEYTEKYTRFFFEDLERLNCLKADLYPRATEHIEDMVATVRALMEKGFAYKGNDGSIYFEIAKYKDYGKLARLDFDGLKAGARVNQDEYDKESVSDFALWKAWDEADGDVFWETPIGKGRPGWHIECSAMSCKYLGTPFDIHCGGVDLVFPHHENELAQTEAATGGKFVNYWVHNEHLLVNGKKMSKSAGNFYTLRDLQEKGFSPAAIRYSLMSVHYRQQLNFTFDGLNAADQAVKRMRNFLVDLKRKQTAAEAPDIIPLITRTRQAFEEALDDDMNISEALGVVFNFIRDINKTQLTEPGREAVLGFIDDLDRVLGLFYMQSADTAGIPAEEEIRQLIAERNQARKDKNFSRADAIRDQLKEQGIILEDGPGGTTWKAV